MLNSLTARSLCEIALRQITLRLLPKLTREEVEGEKRRPSLRGSLYSTRPKRVTRDWN